MLGKLYPRTTGRVGFTLIELLVVISIIAILVAALLAATSGTTESARAVKCLSNLRALAQARNSISKFYAGSYQDQDLSSRQLKYTEFPGWISWLSNRGDPFGKHSGNAAKSPVSVKPSTFDMTNEDDRRYALTNGTMWIATARNPSLYTCPTHVKFWQDQRSVTPVWSYVASCSFGYDPSCGKRASCAMAQTTGRNERTVIFAELPLDLNGDEWQKDCVLQYKAYSANSSERKQFTTSWEGTAESIGFVHKTNRGRKCAHVVFVDGHVEKILEPQGAGGISVEDLTALLCEGKDIAFDGNAYSEIQEED